MTLPRDVSSPREIAERLDAGVQISSWDTQVVLDSTTLLWGESSYTEVDEERRVDLPVSHVIVAMFRVEVVENNLPVDAGGNIYISFYRQSIYDDEAFTLAGSSPEQNFILSFDEDSQPGEAFEDRQIEMDLYEPWRAYLLTDGVTDGDITLNLSLRIFRLGY